MKINPKVKLSTSGLGAGNSSMELTSMDTDEQTKKKIIRWKKTTQRLEQANVNLDYESPYNKNKLNFRF